MTKDEIIAKLNSMAKHPTVTLPRDTEALRLAAKLIEQSTEQEPVAFRTESRITKAVGYWTDRVPDYIDANSWEITPLYTQPQEAAPRKPLTDEEIKQAVTKAIHEDKLSWLGYHEDEQGKYTIPALSPSNYQFARAIEAAHGIGEKKWNGEQE